MATAEARPARLGRLERVGAQRAAQATHDDGRPQAAAEDVPHDDADPTCREEEHVVPVAPHAPLFPGQVAGGQFHTGNGGQPGRQQAAL